MVKTLEREIGAMINPYNDRHKRKRIAVSSKRQISIPKEFFDSLEIGSEVMIELDGNCMIISPISESSDDFSEFILKDLIAEGYEGEELITEFSNRKSQIKPALSRMIVEERPKATRYSANDLDSLFEDDAE